MPQTLPNLFQNEVFALQRLQDYAEQGLTVDETNGEFAHFPVPRRFGGTKGAWLLHDDHMAQGLIQADDFGTTTFHHGDTAAWVSSCDDPYFLNLWEKWRLHHNHVMDWNGVGLNDQTRETYLAERKKGGTTTFQRGSGLFSADQETKAEWSKKGGRAGKGTKKPWAGKSTNSQRWRSLVDPSFVSTASGVVSYHKGKGWDTSLRERLYDD